MAINPNDLIGIEFIMSFTKRCEKCGRGVDIDASNCPKCGFDFGSSPRVIPRCPYCEKELHLPDFYVVKIDKKGRKYQLGFLGEPTGYTHMFNCPFCGNILGFSSAATN